MRIHAGLVLLALGAPGCVRASTALAAPAATLSVASITVGEGLTGTAQVTVRDVTDLYGYDVSVAFDPAVVAIADADPAAAGVQLQLGDFLDPGFVLRNVVDNEAGTAELALTQLSPSPARQGDGTLFHLTFRGIRAGATSHVTVTSAQLATIDGNAIDVMFEAGTVRVVAPASAPDTPTPAPPIAATLNLPTARSATGATPGTVREAGPSAPPATAAVRSGAQAHAPGAATPAVLASTDADIAGAATRAEKEVAGTPAAGVATAASPSDRARASVPGVEAGAPATGSGAGAATGRSAASSPAAPSVATTGRAPEASTVRRSWPIAVVVLGVAAALLIWRTRRAW